MKRGQIIAIINEEYCNYEDLRAFIINFTNSRIMLPAILGGFTLYAIFFLVQITAIEVEIIWADYVIVMFYISFLLHIFSAITFVISQGRAFKIELQSSNETAKKMYLLKLMKITNFGEFMMITAVIIMVFSMIHSGIVLIAETYF